MFQTCEIGICDRLPDLRCAHRVCARHVLCPRLEGCTEPGIRWPARPPGSVERM